MGYNREKRMRSREFSLAGLTITVVDYGVLDCDILTPISIPTISVLSCVIASTYVS